jgi:hypothetical protein
MTGTELINLMKKANRRVHVTGTPENGVIKGLDLEGRLFTVVNGMVLNRVVPSSIINRSNKDAYLNPGGDVLWPAPEGNCFGYVYNTGRWRVPPSITGARWEVIEESDNKSAIRAEVDLINNSQFGIPCEFERHIEIAYSGNSLTKMVTEMIRYIGNESIEKNEFRLAPWSLCQFDAGSGAKVIMSPPLDEDIRDLYGSSLSHRGLSDDIYYVNTKTDFRFQLGLGENVQWIEFINGKNFRVKRYTGTLPPGHKYIDIADSHHKQQPSDYGVKLSIYCDPSGFTEIEACGGCPDRLVTGSELKFKVITEYVVDADRFNECE